MTDLVPVTPAVYGAPRTIRPRFGDLERAAHPHPPVPSGEYVGERVEVCDLCGLSWQSAMHEADRVRRHEVWVASRR